MKWGVCKEGWNEGGREICEDEWGMLGMRRGGEEEGRRRL
jgi:hypothetical protein